MGEETRKIKDNQESRWAKCIKMPEFHLKVDGIWLKKCDKMIHVPPDFWLLVSPRGNLRPSLASQRTQRGVVCSARVDLAKTVRNLSVGDDEIPNWMIEHVPNHQLGIHCGMP